MIRGRKLNKIFINCIRRCNSCSWDPQPPPLTRRRIVITGTGLTTPIGNDVSQFWDSLLSKKSGISNILPKNNEENDLKNYPHSHLFTKEFLEKSGTSIAAMIKDPVYIDKRDQREIPLFVAYAQHAALNALKESNLLKFNNPESLVS